MSPIRTFLTGLFALISAFLLALAPAVAKPVSGRYQLSGQAVPGNQAVISLASSTTSGKADPLKGLASLSPLTATLARLGQSENGVAAAAAALYVGAGGLNGIRDGTWAKGLNPLAGFADGNGDITPGSLLSSIGITWQSWESEQRWTQSQLSELTAGGDVVLKAGLDAVLDQGTQLLAGGNVSIDAGRDIVLSALADYAVTKAESSGLSVYPLALKVEGYHSTAEGESTSHTNARIAAGGQVSLDAGRDIALIGGVVSGERVEAVAARDLLIRSVQDEAQYREESVGASLSFNPVTGLSGSFSYGRATGDYENVAEQSGIVAGDGGYAVDAGGRVDLDAGLIVSSADPGLNSLKATELTFSDIENRSEAKTSSYGLSLSAGSLPGPDVGMPAEESESGTARATLSPGELILSDQKQDLSGLNRDRLESNGRVGLYDIDALKQKQQDAAIVSQALNLAVGDIALAAGFAEGSPEKVALHAVAGAVSAAASGGDVGLGAASGALAELSNAILVNVLAEHPDLTPEQRQAVQRWGAALVGAAIGGDLGAATALDAYQYNYLDHADNEERREARKACVGGSQAACERAQQLDEKDRQQQEAYLACRAGGYSGSGCGQVLADVSAALSSYSGIGALLQEEDWRQVVGDPDTLGEIVEIMSPEGVEKLSASERARLDLSIRLLTKDPTGVTAMPALVKAAMDGDPTAILQAVAIFTKTKGAASLSRIVKEGDGAGANTATIGGKTCVYSCEIDGVTRYVGITGDIAKRGQAHMREKGIVIDQIPGLANLSRADARAVEQTLIEFHGLEKNGGTLINKINSISAVKNPTKYEQALVRGAELLKQYKYPGF